MIDQPASRSIAAGPWQRRSIHIVLIVAGVLLSAPARGSGSSSEPGAPGLNVWTQQAPTDRAPSGGGVPWAPLVVGSTSRTAIMEYEAWFGPRTGMYPQPGLTTCLQSSDMKAGGGGYDSSSGPVIAQHVAWLEQMGVDAATVDLTNNVRLVASIDCCTTVDFGYSSLIGESRQRDHPQRGRLAVVPSVAKFRRGHPTSDALAEMTRVAQLFRANHAHVGRSS